MNYSTYYGSDALSRSMAPSTLTSSTSLDSIFAVVAGFLGVISFVIIALAVLQIIGMWKVYTKAGEKGWKTLIPFYNTAMLYKISGMSPLLVLVYIGTIIPVINFFAVIALAIINLYQKINLMKAFKSSTGLTVAMLICPFITYLILGFGKSKYYGFEEKENA